MNDSPRSAAADAEAHPEQVRQTILETPLPMSLEQRQQLDDAKIALHRAWDELDAEQPQKQPA